MDSSDNNKEVQQPKELLDKDRKVVERCLKLLVCIEENNRTEARYKISLLSFSFYAE